MATVRYKAVLKVDARGHGSLELDADLPPGQHSAEVIVERDEAALDTDPLAGLPLLDFGSWPSGFEVSRAEVYGDEDDA